MNVEKITSAPVTFSGVVALNSVAIFGIIFLLLAFAMCVDPLFCLVMSFLPPAVTPKVELQNVQNANPER